MTAAPLTLIPAQGPLLISMPHTGSQIPAALQARMYPYARASRDTDWFLDRLYNWAEALGAGLLIPQLSRYVIDLNRPPDDQSLYPGQDTTSLCPRDQFDRRPIWLPGEEPDAAEIQARIQHWWQPYHQTLQAEIQRIHQRHGRVLLFDAHSIASQVPRFFTGCLPDLNFGTDSGRSCSPAIRALCQTLGQESGYRWVIDGRFKGGYITRAYHRIEEKIFTLQLELSQATYLDETRLSWDPDKATRLQSWLKTLLQRLLQELER